MTLRNAPPVGQDGGACRDDLPDGTSEIFLPMGLDKSHSSNSTIQVLRASGTGRISPTGRESDNHF
jgi:hypothetical protein